MQEQEGVVWSVTLFADWRKLILIIQTDGALSKFMFRDDLTLLGSTILRVAWENKEGVCTLLLP